MNKNADTYISKKDAETQKKKRNWENGKARLKLRIKKNE